MGGPLDGVRILEIAGLGPAPFAGMLLADLGAEVLRVDSPPGATGGVSDLGLDERHDLLGRGKRSAAVDLKHPDGAAAVRRLTALAGRAGHDLTYLALSGALHAIGTPESPVLPVNLLGDYGGGGMLLAVGVLAALWRARETGEGQVVDASIVDGSALLATQLYGLLHAGLWRDAREANLLDGAAPNYGVYRTADGRHLAVGPLEPKFWREFAAGLGLGDADPAGADANPYDVAGWPALRERIAARIAERTRDEWLAVFDGTDACVAPVLSLREAASASHPQLAARGTFVTAHGVAQPAPAPRFSATPAALSTPPPYPGEHTRDALAGWGVADVEALLATGAAVQR